MAGIRGESRFFTQKIAKCTSKMLRGLTNKELRTFNRKTNREFMDAAVLGSSALGTLACIGQEFKRRKLKK